jgi:hypothetical protein
VGVGRITFYKSLNEGSVAFTLACGGDADEEHRHREAAVEHA